jgi:hypothetical protein
VKTFALTAALALALGLALPARAIEVVDNPNVTNLSAKQPDLAARPFATMLSNLELSELPEPEVFAMMLLGLVLIGYRASRDSNEKFK